MSAAKNVRDTILLLNAVAEARVLALIFAVMLASLSPMHTVRKVSKKWSKVRFSKMSIFPIFPPMFWVQNWNFDPPFPILS